MSDKLSLTDLLNYTTVRIEIETKDNIKKTGTGFFFRFHESKKGFNPVIITNKHVIDNARFGTFHLIPSNDKGMPLDKEKKCLNFRSEYEDFEERWKYHPDENVDLCVMGFTDAIYLFEKQFNCRPFLKFIDKSMIPSIQNLERLSTIEDVYMVGYPNGLWDEYNNKPFIRKGITATNAKFDYNGKKEFAIDMACFPGSSGSPILIVNHGIKYDKHGVLFETFQGISLLGVLYAGPQHFVESFTYERRLPIYSKIPNNIGYVIKAERVLELESIFKT